MLIYLYGPDSYRRNQKLREITSEYQRKRGGLDFLTVDFEDDEGGWLRVREFLNQPSMFVSSKFLVIKNLNFLPKEEIKEAAQILRKYIDVQNVFILVSDGDKPVKDFGFLLEEPVKSKFFGDLDRKSLEVFVNLEAKREGLVFEDRALFFLIDYLMSQNDRTWRAVNNIRKISLAKFSQPVSLEDLRKVIVWVKADESFGLATQFLKSGTIQDRLVILERFRLRGDEGRYTFNLLCSLARGRRDILKLARCDEAVKSGELDDEAALLDFVLSG